MPTLLRSDLSRRPLAFGTTFAFNHAVVNTLTGPLQQKSEPDARARLLVIEDADDAREMLRFLLQMEGYDVDTAANGHEGLAAARARPPAAAVIDIGLPGIDGWAVATTLRREFDDRIRLIAYTSWGRAEDRARSAAAGFDAHLVKPVGLDSLIQTIRTLLYPN